MIIDLHPTDDQQMIADSIGGMLADTLPVSRLREKNSWAAATEQAMWRDFAELGLFGMALPEDEGGAGYGLPEEIVAARELGRVLATPSLLAQIAAGHLAGGEDRSALVSGEKRAAFASPGVDGALYLYDGTGADFIVVLNSGASLCRADEFEWSEAVPMDETISVHRASTAPALSERNALADRISLLISAALAGQAQSATDLAVDYAGQREQFGQPIGSFQAIKHALADMRVLADAADSQSRVAAVAFGLGRNDQREVAAARWLAGNAALENAKAGIQVHGGMGFTAECDAHIYLKRAHLLSALGSSRRSEERRLIA